MPKLHRISEVAKMLGISTETIRYYESVGVIKPSRDEKNGYRYYGGWDIHMLARARLYRLYGFSLEDTAKMLGSPDIASVEDGLKKQEEILEQELIWKMNQLQRIRQERSNMAEIQNGMGNFEWRKIPPFIVCICRRNTQQMQKMRYEIWLLSGRVMPRSYFPQHCFN